MSGKILEKNGATMRDIMLIAPPLSPILRIPNHKDSIPVNPMEISKPVFEDPKADCITSIKMLVLPVTKNWMQATTNAMRINPIQM
jgi:hypothetical protein